MRVQDLTVEEKIKRAKTQLQNENAFFSYLIVHAQFKKDKNLPSPAGVKPTGLAYYNPEYMKDASIGQIKTYILHETLHLAFEHPYTNTRNRDFDILNMAEDTVVNALINAKVNYEWPDNGIIPDNNGTVTLEINGQPITIKNPTKKNHLQVYDEIMEQIKNQGQDQNRQDQDQNSQDKNQNEDKNQDQKQDQDQKQNQNQGQDNQDQDQTQNHGDYHEHGDKEEKQADNPKDGKSQSQSQDWGEILAGAVQASLQSGEKPLGVEEEVDRLLGHKLSWRALLKKYVKKEIPNNFTWQRESRHSRRFKGIRLPGIKKGEKLNTIVAIDSSGSMNKETLGKAKDDLVELAQAYKAINMTILSFDTKVYSSLEINHNNKSEIEDWQPKGRGGTDLRAPFKWARKHKPRTNLMILLTDGAGPRPGATKGIKPIWVLIGRHIKPEKIKTGRVIQARN